MLRIDGSVSRLLKPSHSFLANAERARLAGSRYLVGEVSPEEFKAVLERARADFLRQMQAHTASVDPDTEKGLRDALWAARLGPPRHSNMRAIVRRAADMSARVAAMRAKAKGCVTRAEIDALLAEMDAMAQTGDLSAQESRNLGSLWLSVVERASGEGLMTPQEVVGSKFMLPVATAAMAFSGGGAGKVGPMKSSEGPVLPRTTGNRTVTSTDKFGIDQKVRRQLESRGWTEKGIEAATNEGRVGTSIDKRSPAKTVDGLPRNDPATVYGSKAAHVVINDRTREVVHVNDKTDPEWKIDGRIKWDEMQ